MGSLRHHLVGRRPVSQSLDAKCFSPHHVECPPVLAGQVGVNAYPLSCAPDLGCLPPPMIPLWMAGGILFPGLRFRISLKAFRWRPHFFLVFETNVWLFFESYRVMSQPETHRSPQTILFISLFSILDT